MKKRSMRDSFFDKLYEIAKADRNVIIVSADMGAPSLDKFRRDLNSQYVNVGIAEIDMVTVATGLALSGKKVYTYAIMPFVTLRCYEAIKVNISVMKLPITTVGVGSGFSYEDSGPTHHSTEDIAIMRALPHMVVLNSSDSVMSKRFAQITYTLQSPSYVRLDREVLPDIYTDEEEFSEGLVLHKTGEDLTIIATGNMVHIAIEISKKLKVASINAGIIDLYRIKPINSELLLKSIKTKKVVTLEENFLDGGMGSAVLEVLADGRKNISVKRFGVKENYYYAYGGRKNIQKICGLGMDYIIKEIKKWYRQTK